jgi:hypothetical protein
LDHANLIRDILSKSSGKDSKNIIYLAIEKLLHLLVYLATLIDGDESLKIL